ncbi:glycosyltransferase family 4 protein [Candidatus Roizmanbacteria bacterium]|nr:glycosyltransferase family 4 protein [Candidatus Roizmanbacteria bacterium]
MKIGIYDPYLDDLGGGEKYMLTIAECLSKKHDVYVFWDNRDDFEGIKKRFALNLDKVKLCENIFSSKINFGKKLLKSQKYDVIIVVSDGSIPFVLSKKLFLHIQQPLERINVSSWKDKIKLARVSGVFYNSEFTRNFDDKIFSTVKSVVIYPPVFIPDLDVKKEDVILHVGRFRPTNNGTDDFKKQAVMIEEFKKLVDMKQIKNWKFLIAASIKNSDEGKFEQLKKSAKGYPIEFFINQTNDELWNLYGKAKIYWHASGYGENLDKHPEYAEHFGISTVEAMGAGVVPVAINAGGQIEIITNGKNGFLWNNLEELQSKTEKLIKDSKLLMEMSKEAKIRAKDFSKEKFNERIINLIEQ